MLKLLIVDDEPLVQAGLRSMLNWEELDIEICGIAGNGQTAYEMIQENQADIVIADIRMPIMSGLELLQKCHEEFTDGLPVFLMLTSYEDFQYAREALRYAVIDYLVKLELTPDILRASIERAKAKVLSIKKTQHQDSFESFNLNAFRDRFYIHLLNNLFEDEEAFYRQAKNLEIDFPDPQFTAALLRILPPDSIRKEDHTQQLTLYTSTLQMFQKIVGKTFSCRVVKLDLQYFAVIFSFKTSNHGENKELLKHTLEKANDILFKYYNVQLQISVGRFLENPSALASSYRDAKQLGTRLNSEQSLLFIDDFSASSLKNVFDMSLFRDSIKKAFDEFDEDALHSIFSSIFEMFQSDDMHFTQAMDAAGNILHLTLTLLTNGSDEASRIFAEEPDGYHSLYRQTSVSQVLSWLRRFDSGLGKVFREHRKDYKNLIVANVKKYIQSHVAEHITLPDTADAFSISPNYLSVLFSKNNDMGFNEYVTHIKIQEAKKMLRSENRKVYEVADNLGFESAFYFSRVFKKATGYTPKEYQTSTGDS